MEGSTVVGYIATSMTTVTLDVASQRQELDLDAITHTPNGKYERHFPALLIGMLGECNSHERRGLGAHMVRSVIGQALRMSNEVGCRFVTVDSHPTDAAMGLYKNLGFKSVELPNNKSRDKTVWMYFNLGRR
jgi:hypothetical protein